MHVLDDGHLLTIDYDDAVGADGVPWFNGVTLRVFDVTSPTEAQLAQEVVIGTRGVSAGAATNPLAFDYVAARQMLTAPITLCESGPFSSGIMTFNGLQLYRVDVDDGFALQGSVSHPYVEWGSESSPQVGAGCPDHWTQANSVVKRAVFLGDSVYSISDVLVRVSDLRDLSGDPATIGLSVH